MQIGKNGIVGGGGSWARAFAAEVSNMHPAKRHADIPSRLNMMSSPFEAWASLSGKKRRLPLR
jgi:hypothetical protein